MNCDYPPCPDDATRAVAAENFGRSYVTCHNTACVGWAKEQVAQEALGRLVLVEGLSVR